MKKPAVFMDRDGVVIRAVVRGGLPHPAASLSEVEVLPGVPEALALLRAEGYWLIMVTNQPDVVRGTTTLEQVIAINDRLLDLLPLDGIETCFHDNDDGCECRKPQPGMLLKAAREFDIDFTASHMVGDRWSDIEAGKRSGCKTYFLDYGYAERRPEDYDFHVGSLLEAARTILKNREAHDFD